jgi:arsenical pump membrane protein
VVFGMGNGGLRSVLAALLGDIARRGNVLTAVSVGYGAAGMSSAMNNMPSVLVGALSIHASKAVGSAHEAMIYANVIGCDLGPKLTPIGSLATLLWLHVLDKRGMHIGWGYYVRTGFALTLPVLAITLLALAGWLHVLG